MHKRHLPIALVVLLMLPAKAQVNDRPYSNTPAIGGMGGGEFQAMCPGKSIMIGIGGRTGAWIDAVHPLCGEWDQRRRDFRRIGDGRQTGGGGGGPAEIKCPARTAVGGWEIAERRHDKGMLVQYVRLLCVASTSSGAQPIAMPRYGGADAVDSRNTFRYRCPPSMLANGIYGRSGAFLDNAGLACARTGTLFPLPGQ